MRKNNYLGWLSKNIYKLIFLFLIILLLSILIIFLLPFLHLIGFIADILNEIFLIFNELDKQLNEFEWETYKDNENNEKEI